MNRVPNNKKVIFLLSALCCLLLVCVNIYQQKTWRSMDLIIFMGQSNMSGAGGDAKCPRQSLPKEPVTSIAP